MMNPSRAWLAVLLCSLSCLSSFGARGSIACQIFVGAEAISCGHAALCTMSFTTLQTTSASM